MNTCKDCKFWEREPERSWGTCKKDIGAVGEIPEDDGCIGDGRSEDGTGNGRTGKDFGCIHFEPK